MREKNKTFYAVPNFEHNTQARLGVLRKNKQKN